MKIPQIAPSVLSADFSKLQEEVESVRSADLLHLDLMDGHFVPNLTFGPSVFKDIETDLALDWHLLTEKPEVYFEEIRKIGGEFITVHFEACPHLHRTLQNIKSIGFKAAVSINPATPTSFLKEIISEVEMVLIMSVNPGFGGQKFIDRALKKIERIKKLNNEVLVEVDGGINAETGLRCLNAGADILVAGSYIFGASDRKGAIESLRKLEV